MVDMAAAAHIVTGVVQRRPQLVRQAGALLDHVQATSSVVGVPSYGAALEGSWVEVQVEQQVQPPSALLQVGSCMDQAGQRCAGPCALGLMCIPAD